MLKQKTVAAPVCWERLSAGIVAISAISWWIYSAYSIFMLPPEKRIQFVPDDFFYYLALARNFAMSGQWSFDSGISVTTGYHPLHAYALVGLLGLTDASGEVFADQGILLSVMVALPAITLGAVIAVRSGSLIASLLFLVFLLSRNYSLNTVSGMECSWTLSLSALYLWVFWRYSGSGLARWALPLCGFLGALSRTDFGLLPAALLTAALLSLRVAGKKSMAVNASFGLAASIFGVAAALFHNYITTGQYLQSSAKIKSLWLQQSGASMKPFAEKVVALFGEPSEVTLWLMALVLLGSGVAAAEAGKALLTPKERVGTKQELRAKDLGGAVVWLGSLFAIVAYLGFYSLNPEGIQHWYTGIIMAPLFVVITVPFSHRPFRNPSYLLVLIVLAVLAMRQIPLALAFRNTPEWSHQETMLRAGRYLQENPTHGRLGSWNSGIIGYYEGGHVVNLDGLVNNDIYEYAKQNQIVRYLDERNIRFVVDFINMFETEAARRRGGYDSPEFLARLVPIRRFDDKSDGWRQLTLYEIKPVEERR